MDGPSASKNPQLSNVSLSLERVPLHTCLAHCTVAKSSQIKLFASYPCIIVSGTLISLVIASRVLFSPFPRDGAASMAVNGLILGLKLQALVYDILPSTTAYLVTP